MEKIIAKPLKWLFIAALSLVMAVFMVLQLPYVQNRLFGKLLQHLSHTTQFAITHQHFQLKWLRHTLLTGFTIKDLQNNTLLAVDQLELEVSPWQLLINRYVTLKNLNLEGARVQLRKEGDQGYNVDLLLQRLVGNTAPRRTPQHAAPFVIEKASLHDIEFSMDNQQTAPLQDKLDFNHLKIDQINAQLAKLKVQEGVFEVTILQLAGKHATIPLLVDHLSTSLVVSSNSVVCKALNLQMGQSALKGNCILTYDPSAAALINEMQIVANLDHTVLSCEELGAFIPYFKQYNARYTLSGALQGKLKDFQVKNFQLGFGEHGDHLQGQLTLQGLPHIQEALFDMKLEQGVLHTAALFPYLEEKYYRPVEKFKFVKLQGHCYGRLDDFTAKGTFDTDLGNFTTALAFKVDPATQQVNYQGAIATSNLDLGMLLNNDSVQKLTMQGQIAGKYLHLATTYFQLKTHIHKLGLYNYDYKNIHTHGHFNQGLLQANLTVDDPHLKLQADAAIDLGNCKDNITVQGVLNKADLKPLQFTSNNATISTRFFVALQGLSLDSMQADVQLNELQFGLEGKQLKLDSLQAHLGQEKDASKVFALDSAWCTVKGKGNFTYPALTTSFQQLLQGYQRHLTHSVQSPQKHITQPCTLAYQVHCKDINPLLHFFVADSYVSPDTILEGRFTQDQGTTFTLHLREVASLAFRTNQWTNTQFDLTAYQAQGSQGLSATAQLVSKTQQWSKLNNTENFALLFNWKDEQIDFSNTFEQQSTLTHFNLQGKALLLADAIEITLHPSKLQLAGQQWHLDPNNRIIFNKACPCFQNLEVASGEQKVSLAGTLSTDPSKVLYLQIKDFSASNFNLFTHQPLTGVLNATVALQGALNQPIVKGDVSLQNLTVNGCLVGDIHAKTRWKDALKRLYIDCQLVHLQQQTIGIKGVYQPEDQENSLQLIANFSQAPLAALAPLVHGTLSQLAGELNGTIYINGNPSDLQITGQASITDAAMKVDYLNTHYRFDGALTCIKQSIQLTQLTLYDDQHGKAMIQGAITYQGFEIPHVELVGSMTNFKLSDTVLEDDAGFYGTSILSGELTVSGPSNNVAIHAKLKTEPGTQALILIQQATNTIAQEGFIRFVSFDARPTEQKPITLKGVQLTLTLEITRDAYTKLILNRETGNTIKGKGEGNIKLTIDTAGVLSITGDFELLEGEYNFSLYQLVNKTFKIVRGSKITWYGSPEQGILDFKASYDQQVTLAPLFENSEVAKIPNAKKKYPVQVILALQGPLSAPDISFQVQFLEHPNDLAVQAAVNAFQKKAEKDEAYLTSQVVSLVILKSFGDSIANVGLSAVGKNISELFSQQLSNLVGRLDKDLEIDTDVDLSELDGPESLKVKLSYSLFKGRLKLSREGSLSIGASKEERATNLIGDLTVEYLLTKDGKLRAKVYNKNIANPAYAGTSKVTNTSGGFSLLYTKSFNRWQELWRNKRRDTPKANQEN